MRAPEPELHPEPPRSRGWAWWEALLYAAIRPLGEVISPATYADALGAKEEALDVNAFGQVYASSWFTPRIGRWVMTPDEVAAGGDTLTGPTTGPWIVLGGKVEGATPGLIMQDLDGVTFLVKFDPPAFPELSSAAELISTKILWAAGYNVPENYLGICNLRWLQLSPRATTGGEYGEEVPLNKSRLAAILAHVNPLPDGTVRALFSRIVPGTVLGPGSYRGVRAGDPNDKIPHQHRRSLRGLWLFSAWLNNTDTRDANTLDVFVPTGGGLGYVQHYLLDFGDALGAAGVRPKYIGEGYVHRVDWDAIFGQLLSLGLYYPYWLPVRRAPFRSVGVFEAEVFEPSSWRPNLPNPAFDAATELDTYWAGSIIARFTPEILRAIVARAGYSEPGAADYLLEVLLRRRLKVLRHAFEPVLALDDPSARGFTVTMTDLEHEAGLIDGAAAVLSWSLRAGDRELASGQAAGPRFDLQQALGARPSFADLVIRRARGGPALVLHLRVLEDGVLPVGLEREVD